MTFGADPVDADNGPFVEDGILNVSIHLDQESLYVTWDIDETVPINTIYQIYVNNILKWEDITNHAAFPVDGNPGDTLTLHVGRVGPNNRGVDYSATLPQPAGSGNRVRLTWIGGKWLSPDLQGFKIYQSTVAGGPVDHARPVANLPAHVGDEWGDGYGRGPYGRGAYGRGSVLYEWTSQALAPGVWSFSVAPYDGASREPAPLGVVSFTIVGPPDPPALVNGKRVYVSAYDPATRAVTLQWSNA